jgi:hypothetical protein
VIEGPILPDQVFQYLHGTGQMYIVDSSTGTPEQPASVSMKHPETGKWIPCVIYRNPGMSGFTFVRAEPDFREKFRRV